MLLKMTSAGAVGLIHKWLVCMPAQSSRSSEGHLQPSDASALLCNGVYNKTQMHRLFAIDLVNKYSLL